MHPLTVTGMPLGGPGMTLLDTIAGVSYYELRVVVKNEGGRTAIVGLANDWPIHRRDATIADLESRLAAAERQRAELEQQLLVQAEADAVARGRAGDAPPDWATYAGCQQCAADGRRGVVADSPDLPHLCRACAAAVLPAPPPAKTPGARAHVCPECGASFERVQALAGHRAKKHGYRATKPAPPRTPVAAAPEAPFVCADCGSSAHARSVLRPELCMRCNARRESTAKDVPVAAA